MLYKDKELQMQYRSGQLAIQLRETVLVLEVLANRSGIMPNGLTITSIHRPKDVNSYHSKWQAIDIRNNDWSPKFFAAVRCVLEAIRSLDPRCQFEFEPSERHPDSTPHLHLEYDDGTLHKHKEKDNA